jgi:hypothetical protein
VDLPHSTTSHTALRVSQLVRNCCFKDYMRAWGQAGDGGRDATGGTCHETRHAGCYELLTLSSPASTRHSSRKSRKARSHGRAPRRAARFPTLVHPTPATSTTFSWRRRGPGPLLTIRGRQRALKHVAIANPEHPAESVPSYAVSRRRPRSTAPQLHNTIKTPTYA